SKASSLQGRP
ncbi:unnamed protein product, partial [Allacma fusca]